MDRHQPFSPGTHKIIVNISNGFNSYKSLEVIVQIPTSKYVWVQCAFPDQSNLYITGLYNEHAGTYHWRPEEENEYNDFTENLGCNVEMALQNKNMMLKSRV